MSRSLNVARQTIAAISLVADGMALLAEEKKVILYKR